MPFLFGLPLRDVQACVASVLQLKRSYQCDLRKLNKITLIKTLQQLKDDYFFTEFEKVI